MSTGLQIAVALLFLLPSMATAAIADTMQLSPQLHTRPVYAADFSMSKVRLLEDSSKALKAANTYDAGIMPANYSYYGNLAFQSVTVTTSQSHQGMAGAIIRMAITTDANGTRGGVMHGNDGCMGRMGGGMMNCQRPGGQAIANASQQTPVSTDRVIIPKGAADPGNSAPYQPLHIKVERGTTVTWTNNDSLFHSVTDAGKKFDSGLFGPGKTWTHTFDTTGRHDYYCSVHPWMKGVVEVAAR
jgi:plastocyanin